MADPLRSCLGCGHSLPESRKAKRCQLCSSREPHPIRRQQILDAIARLSVERGFPPTMREVGKAIGLASSATIYAHLQHLKRDGVIDWDESQVRTLRVIQREVAA
jgi:repressor LexA